MNRKPKLRLGLAVLATGGLVLPATVAAIVPTPAPPPPLTATTIDDGPGAQVDPHVSGELVSYTAQIPGALQTEIRYFDFRTGVDGAIPRPSGASDNLSDVDGDRIVFTRSDAGAFSVQLFDATSGSGPVEVAPDSAARRRGVSIGGDTIAWVDITASTTGDIVVHELGGTPVRLTNDGLVDFGPDVSPDGSVVVWQRCADFSSACDVAVARKTGGTWSVGAATSSPTHELTAATDGSIVVFASCEWAACPRDRDVHWYDLATGATHRLELEGEQRQPSVSGSLILFESLAPADTNHDLYVYDLRTNALSQLTRTPALDETLSDIALDGTVARVAYSVFEADNNVYGLTFDVPSVEIPAEVSAAPGTLNLKSKGAYLTACVELPGRGPADVDAASITLRAVAPAASATIALAAGAPTATGDCDADGTADLTVKFDRAAVQSWFAGGADPATLRLAGRLRDGTPFAGEAQIRVIDAGVSHTDEANPGSVKP